MLNGHLNGPSHPIHAPNLHSTVEQNEIEDWKPPTNLFELSNSLSLESRIYEAGLIIKRAMQIRSPTMIKERHVQRSVSSFF